uniref:Uncharacterized protein n=1 Tax=Marmota marmota marmota TaxID=9994 RepID=A0A8C5YR72_MARMA
MSLWPLSSPLRSAAGPPAAATWKNWTPKTSTLEEDEDYEPLGGEYSEDNVNELGKEAEVDSVQQTKKPKCEKIRL